MRASDTIARFGGDEFIVVLSELETDEVESYKQAQAIAEKMRLTLAALYRLTVNSESKSCACVEHRCTASIGVTLFTGQESGVEELLKQADISMYRAKESGRNSIRFYNLAE